MKTKFKTEWDLTSLYKSPKDPEIEKDLQSLEKTYKAFAKKYEKDASYVSSPKKLKVALDAYMKLKEHPGKRKPLRYFSLAQYSGDKRPIIQQNISKIENRLTNIQNSVLFFPLSVCKTPEKKQTSLLNSKELVTYHYLLQKWFEHGKHLLSEKEEKILSLKEQPAYGMWTEGLENTLYKQTITFEGKELSIPEANGKILALPTKKRRELHKLIMEASLKVGDFCERELNAIYTDKKIDDELRGYKEPYSETILGYENDEKIIKKFVDLVTVNFKISHRFYKLKKKMLKLEKLSYADRAVSTGKINRKFTFEKSCSLLLDTFKKADQKYHDILLSFLENGQIDVFPKKGKVGGAFQSSAHDVPSVVLLNHTNDFNSVTTFAHEMGHAFHSELSKQQPSHYEHYTISVAETASTFFENFVFDAVFEQLSKKEQIIALHDQIQGYVSSIFRQIALFNFEEEIHKTVREQGYVAKENIAKMMNKHMKSYMGPSFKLEDIDGYFFIQWSHIRRPFYVYSYAYGELISSALYKEYKKDTQYLEKIEQFLSAGNSKSPYNIFKDAGINTNDMKFFEKGLKQIDEKITQLEKLIK